MPAVEAIIANEPKPAPTFTVDPTVDDFYKFTVDSFRMENYQYSDFTGKIPVAVIHPASAGHGLNLQYGGCTLIWYGLTWSLELYQQTNARLWRQGQTESVVIHHILTEDTMDELVMAALHRKDQTQAALIDAVKAVLEV